VRDEIIDYLVKNPWAGILVLLLVPFALVNRYRRMKRRMGHVDDAKSWVMLAFGLVVAIVIIFALLQYS
jgi:uncharacterized membrane protein YidH (DUF202 family)